MVNKKFSDLKQENIAYPEAEFFDAEAKRSLMNKQIEFIDFKIAKGQMGDYAIVLAKDGSKAISFSIGGVVFRQLVDNKKDLPFTAKMVEQKAKQSGRLFTTLE
jgi:hypothetical protein